MSLDMSLCPSVLQVLAHLPIVRPPPLEDIFSDLPVLVADPHHRTAGRKRTMLKPGGHAPVDDLRTSKGLQLQRRAARVSMRKARSVKTASANAATMLTILFPRPPHTPRGRQDHTRNRPCSTDPRRMLACRSAYLSIQAPDMTPGTSLLREGFKSLARCAFHFYSWLLYHWLPCAIVWGMSLFLGISMINCQ